MTSNLEDSQKLVNLLLDILQENGITLDKNSHILDYGCGSARHTYEFLDNGYENCHGFDIKDYVNLQDPRDKFRFKFSEGKLPFDDNTFDFIFSTQVFEHVMDYDTALSEVARVLKPGGISIHIFPAKWSIIEPHIFVPLGGVIKQKWYYKFWAKMGCRNEFQQNSSIQDITKSNYNFATSALNYLSGSKIKSYLSKFFSDFSFVELDFLKHSPGRGRELYPFFKYIPGALLAYRTLHNRVILLKK